MPTTTEVDAELAAVAELARNYFTCEVLPCEARHAEQGHPDPALYRRAGELGLSGMTRRTERLVSHRGRRLPR